MNPPLLLYTFALGLIVGDFVGKYVLIFPRWLERTWRREALNLNVHNRSVSAFSSARYVEGSKSLCPHCGHIFKGIRQVSLIQLLAFGGACSECGGQSIPPIIAPQLLTAALTPFVILHEGLTYTALVYLFSGWIWIALAFMSLRDHLLPNGMTLTLVWLGLLAASFNLTIGIEDAVVGAMVGYLFPWAFYHAIKLTTGREVLGYGVFKGAAAIGALFGVIHVLAATALMLIIKSVTNKFRFGNYFTEYGLLPLGHWLAISFCACYLFRIMATRIQ